MPFEKYNIDVSIDEVENSDSGIKLKYRFILLSTPTNSKISVEGFTSIQGNEAEVAKYLAPDAKKIPLVVNLIYQELFPLFYVTTKSLGIACPAYKISEIAQAQSPKLMPGSTSAQQPQTSQIQEQPEIQSDDLPPLENTKSEIREKEQAQVLEELEHLVEEQNVSTN